MKRVLVLAAVSVALAACADTTPPPAAPLPAPPPVASAPPPPAIPVDPDPVTEGDVTVAWAHGMEILVKRTPGAEFVAAELCIRGGVRNWTAENAGIENVALKVATGGGTKSLAKEAFSRKLASLGATLGGGTETDFSRVATKAPRAAWDELFPVFVDTFLAPALPASEFDLVKQRELDARRREMEDGDGRLALLKQSALFAGHPYAKRSVGTVQTLEAMKLGEIAPYLEKLYDTNRLVLIVVGDVDPAHVIAQARTAFASVPRGAYTESPIPPLHFTAAHVLGDTFKLPTNYIDSLFAGPSWSDPDFIPLQVGMWLLSDREFDEVRTKRNLSYAPAANFFPWESAPFGHLYVTAVDPNTTMKVMFDQVRRLQTELVPQKDIAGAKATFLSWYLQNHEAVDGQAGDLAFSIVLGGDWHLSKTFPERVRATTAEDIQRAATKWITNPQTVIVGDPSKLDPKVVGAP